MKLRKLLASILCVAMVLSTMGTVAFADVTAIEVTNNAELATAIANAVDGDVIKLAAGEYSAFDVSGKNITVKGELDADGEHLTVIKGGSPAITGHNFNGTIKDIKIVDAFKAFYGEPCGNIVFDNLYVTGATYGIHAVAYENGKEWTIQNCYMDISWANSFGRYTAPGAAEEIKGATIIIKDNEFESTSPYYSDYGAPIINTSSPYTVVEDNIIGKNAKFQFLNQDAATGTKIGLNYYVDGVENAIVSDNTYVVPPIPAWYATEDMDEDKVVVNEIYVAEVDGTYYTDFKEALKAIKENSVFNLLSNITITDRWDCRNYGSTGCYGLTTVPYTFDGNGHTLKFTGEISDGFNHLAVFRPEAEATFMNLTVDMSEAIAVFQNRFSVIASKDANLTVINCNFIGSEIYTNARAIIFGETAEHNDAEVVVSGCTFTNFKYGVTDNLNGKDVASVEVTGSEFTNASINVSASEEVTITGNEVDGGYVKVSSYTQSPEQNLTVTVKDNVLDEDFAADNQIQAGAIIDAQDGFTLPVAEVNGKKYMTLKSAVANANDGDVVYLTPGTYEDELTINKSITITGNPNYGASTFATRAAAINKPVIKIKDVTNGGVEYHATNVKFDNLVFEIAEDATGAGWNVSALGYYYEIVANRDGLTVTNCDFINNSNLSLGAIAANIGKYTITNNTFKNFSTGVWSFVDHGAADEIVVSDNTFENVPNLVNIYHGVAANGNADVTIANNKATDDSATQIAVTDFGQTKDTPATAYDNVTITGNDAEVVLGNYAETSFDATVENNDSVVYSYASEAVLRALEPAGVPEGEVYVNYGSANEVMYKVIGGAVYSAANTIEVEFEAASETEGEKVYNINLKANALGIINRLNSADLTFLLTQIEGVNDYEIIASNPEVAINAVDNSKVRYEFHYNGKDNVLTDTDTVITIGQVKFTGYGKFSFAVDSRATTNAAHSTTMQDNIVDTFIPGGDITAGEGDLDISDDTIKEITIAVPDRNLTITVDFPNEVENNVIAYQDMKVVISGGDLDEDITIDLGTDAVATDLDIFGKADAAFVAAMNNGSYVINVTDALTLNNAYTVTVSGAGYRTARYTVTMTEDKALRFWNNVMDENQVVEIGKDTSVAKVTFLAGDIVKDNNINIYDLSAVVSYFGTETDTDAYDAYAKYDLNRDGVIDSKDVAYVLVSWNN